MDQRMNHEENCGKIELSDREYTMYWYIWNIANVLIRGNCIALSAYIRG